MDKSALIRDENTQKANAMSPYRAAILPPQSPRGGRSGSARGSQHHKPLFFEKRLSSGRIPCFDFANVIAPLKTLPQ